MASLTIRNVDDTLKLSLRLQAARHGHSMEQEARDILRRAVQSATTDSDFALRIQKRFAGLGVETLPIPKRRAARVSVTLPATPKTWFWRTVVQMAEAGILLDTNVLSELMRPMPDATVLAWFRQKTVPLYTSTITRAEILLGIALLPDGKRSKSLAVAADQMFAQDFARRCLPFDDEAATEYALLVAARHQAGLPISTEDGQIAAIALRHRLLLATRNGNDFARIEGLAVVNPWQ